MPPLVKINHTTPLIAFNANAGPRLGRENSNIYAGRYEFSDHFCGFFDADFRLCVGHLSQSLTKLREYMDYKLPLTEEVLDSYSLQTQILNCFAPDAVDGFAAAILRGDETELAAMLKSSEYVEPPTITIKDKSWLLTNKYQVYDPDIHSYSSNQDYWIGAQGEYYPKPKVPKFLEFEIKPIANELQFNIDLFTLSLLCKQPKMTRLLLPFYLENIAGNSIFNLSYYELILRFDPELFSACLDHNPKNAFIFLCSFMSKLDNYCTKTLLIKNSCTFDFETIVYLFSNPETIIELNNNSHLSTWLTSSKIEPNKVINERGETIMFLAFAAKAFDVCAIMLEKCTAIDLNIQNNLGQKCFELLSDTELLSQPRMLRAILQNPTARQACNFVHDKSTILQELHIQPDYVFQNFKILVTANPRLLQNKNNANNYCFEYLIENKRNSLDTLAFIRDIYPQVFIEVAVKHNKFILSFANYIGSQESDNDINTLPMDYKRAALDAAKQYLKLHAENSVIAKYSPELLLKIESELNPPINTGSKYKCIIS